MTLKIFKPIIQLLNLKFFSYLCTIKNLKLMKKFIFSMFFAFAAMMLLNGCIVSEAKLTDKVKQSMVEYEQNQGNRLEVTDLKLEKGGDKGYKGVLTGKLNGEDVVYDVTVSDAGNDFDVDWELRK